MFHLLDGNSLATINSFVDNSISPYYPVHKYWLVWYLSLMPWVPTQYHRRKSLTETYWCWANWYTRFLVWDQVVKFLPAIITNLHICGQEYLWCCKSTIRWMNRHGLKIHHIYFHLWDNTIASYLRPLSSFGSFFWRQLPQRQLWLIKLRLQPRQVPQSPPMELQRHC